MFMLLSSCHHDQSHCERSPGSVEECRLNAGVSAVPQAKPTGLEDLRYKWLLPSTIAMCVIITEPESGYSYMRGICGHYIFVLFLYFFMFSSPNLSGRRLDVYHTSTHGVALVREFRMQVWNVLHVACWKCRTRKIAKNSPSGHHRTTLSGYIVATKACIDNRKKNLLKSNVSPTCVHNTVNFCPLATEICWRVWGTQQISTGCTALE